VFRSSQTLPIAVAIVTILAGCVGGIGTSDDASVDDETLIENADALDRYQYTATSTLQAPMVNESTDTEGSIDRTDRSAHIRMTTQTDVGDGPQTRESEQYVFEDRQYTNDDGDWEEAPIDIDDHWSDLDRLAVAAETVAHTDREPIRTEIIDGTETTMFEVNVSEDTRDELAGVDGQQHVQTSVEEFVYYAYIDTETDTLYGTDRRMEVTQGEGSALITTETIFGGFDEEVDHSLPEELE